jgi:hypothetical protein
MDMSDDNEDEKPAPQSRFEWRPEDIVILTPVAAEAANEAYEKSPPEKDHAAEIARLPSDAFEVLEAHHEKTGLSDETERDGDREEPRRF